MNRETVESGELLRFVRAVGAGEVWEQTAQGWWRLDAGHAQALVKPAEVRGILTAAPVNATPGYAWGVRPAGSMALRTGRAPTEHEAMRAAERVLEELR